MTKKLGLYAIPFGFGPVSKAVAIAKAINKKMDVEWVLLGNGISLEFMQREGMNAESTQIETTKQKQPNFSQISRQLDGAVVLMDNVWANNLAAHIPVFFADSLGFMWSKDDFKKFPNMDKLKKYYVQDLFGAYSHMQSLGLKNLAPVSPIIDTSTDKNFNEEPRTVVHLGGLLNPMNPKTTEVYMHAAKEILKRMKLRDPLLLMSDIAKTSFPHIVNGIDARSLPHKKTMSTLQNSDHVFSSPGLTTILEMAQLSVNCSPMPPQNYSQVLNTHNMVNSYGEKLHKVWHFLAKQYDSVYMGMPEEDGVRQVTDLNARLLSSESFLDKFVNLSLDAKTKGSSLPQPLADKRNGATYIANDVKKHFDRPNLG